MTEDEKDYLRFLIGLAYIALSVFVSIVVGLIFGQIGGLIAAAGFCAYAINNLLKRLREDR